MEMNNERSVQLKPENSGKMEYHKPSLVEYGSLQEYTLGFVSPGVEDANFMRMFRATGS